MDKEIVTKVPFPDGWRELTRNEIEREFRIRVERFGGLGEERMTEIVEEFFSDLITREEKEKTP